jgi:ergothioneine biosynthesis protein EgtB
MTVVDARPRTLIARFESVRDQTEALASVLSAEDQAVQSMPDVSPTKWHRAHVTWFFETFLLMPNVAGYTPVEPIYGYLFNSYYETVGERHPRPVRGLITRPSNHDIGEYRARIDESMHLLMESDLGHSPAIVELIELGLHHEQQHQELLLMDILHVLSRNPFAPAYEERAASAVSPVTPLGWIDHRGGVSTVGRTAVDGFSVDNFSFDNFSFDNFSFDNEGPCHQVLLHPHRLADRLVTNGEWLEFMADVAYGDPGLWLSDGWRTVSDERWEAPLYWTRTGDGWVVHTLGGTRPVDPGEPVVHVSYYEAEAFARWAGARLPTEFEWEAHASSRPVEGNLLPSGNLHPLPATGSGLRQMFGDVWEWTSSAYAPYPGFRPADGAVGEYNGKFMIDQQVLRGGACITPGGHLRSTYRNFFPASSRWMFGGVRLAADLGSRV